MIHLIRVLFYPSVNLDEHIPFTEDEYRLNYRKPVLQNALKGLKKLPKKPGIYYAVRGLKIQYIGLSRSLYRRWNATGSKTHHRLHQLVRMGGIKIHYRLCDRHELEYLEALEIRRFDPPLNVVKPIPENHLNWRIRLQSLPVIVGALAAAIVGLGVVEATLLQRRYANDNHRQDSNRIELRNR